jgi:hypothetical protein
MADIAVSPTDTEHPPRITIEIGSVRAEAESSSGKGVRHGHGNLPSGHKRRPAINATIKTKTSAQSRGEAMRLLYGHCGSLSGCG